MTKRGKRAAFTTRAYWAGPYSELKADFAHYYPSIAVANFVASKCATVTQISKLLGANIARDETLLCNTGLHFDPNSIKRQPKAQQV